IHQLARERLLPDGTALLGVGRGPSGAERYRALIAEALAKYSRSGGAGDPAWTALLSRTDFIEGDFEDASTYARLKRRMEGLEQTTGGNRLFYLATASSAFPLVLIGL